VLAQRLRAQLLSGPPARDPVAVCERLLAVQGQDPRGFRLAIRARTRGVTARDVDRALNDRALVVTWLNRGTLHLIRSEDYWWLHALTAPPQRTGILRRLQQEGVDDPDRGVAAIERALADEGPLVREQLRDRVTAAGSRTEGQALIQLLALAASRGLIVRGPVIGKQHAYVLARDWLGEAPRVDRDVALGELARRYLAGHGPADDRDLAKWAGLPLRDARAGLERAGAPRSRRAAAPPPPRLLGAFDPVLLGWASRDDVTGPHAERLVSGGIFRPFALVGGRAAALWRLDGDELDLDPFEPLAGDDLAALRAEARDVRRFLAL
jgi:winged helix DNA-binding protein